MAGLWVKVSQSVGEDISGVAMSLRIGKVAAISGNSRLVAGHLLLDAPVAGKVVASAATFNFNGTIGGDARFIARDLSCPDARILGTLTYSAPNEIQISATVIAADRVHFQKMEPREMMRDWRDRMPNMWPAFPTILTAFVLLLLCLAVIGSIVLTTAPDRIDAMRWRAIARPVPLIGLGILAMATTVGLIPRLVTTLVGIPLIPVVLLAMIGLWTGGYLLGVFTITTRVSESFGTLPNTVLARFALLLTGLAVMALLNFIPVIGWLANATFALLAMGAIVSGTLEVDVRRRAQALPLTDDRD